MALFQQTSGGLVAPQDVWWPEDQLDKKVGDLLGWRAGGLWQTKVP
jgi:hypothetical protein